MPNFSQSLAQYSQAVANRKTRREIKKQQEEAAAAARSAQNARSNRGFMGTLGGAAAAIGVGATGGWNPATMAMAYQAGSALGSGLNSIVKPYNQQEVRGMPYTQPSGWETFNQVAPAVGSAYGAYQTAQQQQQQSDYNNQLNNLLKMHQIMDMNPAATTGMINQLNSDHTKKYELDGKQPYMFDMGATSGGASDQYNYKKNQAQWDSALKTHIDNGNTGWILSQHDSEQWDRTPYLSRDDAMAMANRNREANLAKAGREADAANRAKEKHSMAVTEYTQTQADRMIEPFAESIKLAKDEKEVLRLYKNFDEEFNNSENLTGDQKALLSNQLNAKYHDVVVKPKQEQYGKQLEEMVKGINAQQGGTTRADLDKVGKLAGLSENEIEAIWVTASNKAGIERDNAFLKQVKNLDLWNVDIMGKEVRREPEVVRQQISYIWRMTGASQESLGQALDAVGVLNNGQVEGGGYAPDVPDTATMNNYGNGAIMALPRNFDITNQQPNPRQPYNLAVAPPQQNIQTQTQQKGQSQTPAYRPNFDAPPDIHARDVMKGLPKDGPPADINQRRVGGSPAAKAAMTPLNTGASSPPASEGDDELTGIPVTDQRSEYAAKMSKIKDQQLQKTQAQTTQAQTTKKAPENSLTNFRSDAMNDLYKKMERWQELGQQYGGQ